MSASTDVDPTTSTPLPPHAARPEPAARVRRRGPAGWTLRRRLVFIIVAVVAVLGVSISGVALTSLHSYLVSRLDVQVGDALGRASNAVQGRGPGPQDDGQGPGADARQNFGTITARLTSSGRIASYEGVPQIGISGDNGNGRLSVSTDVFASVPLDGTGVTVDLGGSLRFYRVAAERLPDGSRILVGLPFAEADATLAQLFTVLVIVVIAAILLSLLAGLLIVRLALRPLARVAATAQRVATLPLDRGEVVLGERVPGTRHRPAHGGRPRRKRVQQDARARAGRTAVPRDERAQGAPVRGRREPRAAHAARLDPRVRGAHAPWAACAPARGHPLRRAHRVRGDPHDGDRRGPPAPRPPR